MPKIVTKPRPAPRVPEHPIGTLLPGSSLTSKLEETARTKLTAAGVNLVGERLGIQCGLDEARNKYPVLTPDMIVADSQVCIEIDSDRDHADRVDEDRRRNELLAEVGWRVVRLRLGGLEAIGEWDVVSGSGTLTVAAVPALVEAIADAVAGCPGRVRKVARKPTTPRTSSRLGALREDEYKHGVHNMKWKLPSGESIHLAVVGGGRYLGRVMKSEFPRFLRPLDLLGTEKDQWRKALEPMLEGMEAADFEPGSTFPWGDSMFIGPQANKIRLHEKFNPAGPGEQFTTNLDGVTEYSEAIIKGDGGVVLAELHAEAIALGWHIQNIQACSGRYGDYLEVILARRGFEA